MGGGDFEQVGRGLLSLLVANGLRRNSRVLDMGCGIGRVAIPMTEYLSSEGSYEGFDIVPSSIDWCRANIGERLPSFRFVLLDVANSRYNTQGSFTAENVQFPYREDDFDFAFAISLFTHLLPTRSSLSEAGSPSASRWRNAGESTSPRQSSPTTRVPSCASSDLPGFVFATSFTDDGFRQDQRPRRVPRHSRRHRGNPSSGDLNDLHSLHGVYGSAVAGANVGLLLLPILYLRRQRL